MSTNDIATLRKARRFARAEFNRLRQLPQYRGHASHAASAALEAAEARFDLGTCGVEGFCDECGREGVSYLNAGDPYVATLICVTDYSTARFSVGSWGDIVERNPDKWG